MKILYIINGAGLSDVMGGSSVRSVEIAKRLAQLNKQEARFMTPVFFRQVQQKQGKNND